MRSETQSVRAKDGIELFVRSYCPDNSEPDRTIYWVHGLGEHGGRLEHVAQMVTQSGWRMIAPDLRGHGMSSGTRTHVRSFDEYAVDTALIWESLRLDSASTALLGNSMGGLVAVRAVQTGVLSPMSLVLASPLLGLKLRINPFAVLLGRLVVGLLPTARFSNEIDPSNMTHDTGFAAQRRGDPLMIKTVTAGWFFAMQDALKAANQQASAVQLPVLGLQGTADETTDPSALATWLKRIGSKDREMILLDGHFHELFFEPDWLATTGRMLKWLEEHSQIAETKERP